MKKTILDPCCGSRMMWFDKNNADVVFGDIREEKHVLCDGRQLVIAPDVLMDFRAIPFADKSFKLVVFDPPHLKKVGDKSWLKAKYGKLADTWKQDLTIGFSECFRVLDDYGVLVFKWSEDQVKIKEVISLTPKKPLFGHPSGRSGKTMWVTFIKHPVGT